MVNKQWVIFLIVLLSINLGFAAVSGPVQEINDYAAIEKFLRTAKIVSVIPDEEAGRTEPWKIVLTDGQTRRIGYFKHLSLIPMVRDSYKFELAAYELSKLLQMNNVPPVIEREIEGVSGSLQLFLEDYESLIRFKRKEVPHSDPQKFEAAMQIICVLEQLTFCKRADEDIFVHNKTGKIFRVDFSEAFAPVHCLLPGFNAADFPEKIISMLSQFSKKQAQERLDLYLSQEEIAAIFARRDLVLEKLKN